MSREPGFWVEVVYWDCSFRVWVEARTAAEATAKILKDIDIWVEDEDAEGNPIVHQNQVTP